MAKFHSDTQIISSEEYNGLVLEFRKYKNTPLLNAVISSSGEGHYLSDFLSQFNDKYDVINDLLPILNDVLNMNLLNEVISAETICAYVEKDNTYFIEGSDLVSGKKKASENPNMFISTYGFKKVSEKWLEFLKSQENQKSQA